MEDSLLKKLSAFTTDPAGGNPAGVWIGENFPETEEMQRIAAEIGYSETAFISPRNGQNRSVRYFSPEKEVPFCGHATIASGVALGEMDGMGSYNLDCEAGRIEIVVSQQNNQTRAALTSVTTEHKPVSPPVLADALKFLKWRSEELDDAIPPVLAYAGAWHLILACKRRERLSELDYAFEPLKQLMLQNEITTVNLIWRENKKLFHARNPFPVGGVVEDPATGAAAAALGGYLRDSRLLSTPAQVEIKQGYDMGRPSDIYLEIPPQGGVIVSGAAVEI